MEKREDWNDRILECWNDGIMRWWKDGKRKGRFVARGFDSKVHSLSSIVYRLRYD